VGYDAVKLGLDASVVEVAQYQAAWHNINIKGKGKAVL
jgi:hypothetical protein